MADCYAMLRGSAVRVTSLTSEGDVPSPARYAVSRSVARVVIDEITEDVSDTVHRNSDNEAVVVEPVDEELIAYGVEATFLKTDPAILSLMTSVPLVLNAKGEVVGFEADLDEETLPFALEVWSTLEGGGYGHTPFPFLAGGRIGAFEVANGLVSFTVRGAVTQPIPHWGVGPYDIRGVPFERMTEEVSGNWRNHVLDRGEPPESTNGIVEFDDVLHGGDADEDESDIIHGGDAEHTTAWIIYGGRA